MPKILLVDDDIELTELLAELLSLEGFNTHIVHNGQEALDELERKHYDLILLDIMMPVLNGLDMLKQLRQNLNLAIPVLMLSARDDHIDRVLGLELGADDYLPKPFNDRELVARIKAILRRSQILNATETTIQSTPNSSNESSQPLTLGGVELHIGLQQATFEGKELDLTRTEFELLQLLMNSPGKIISREYLSTEILGKDLTPFDRSIDMHMSNLRKKLPNRNDNRPWFKTLRGRGYLLVV